MTSTGGTDPTAEGAARCRGRGETRGARQPWSPSPSPMPRTDRAGQSGDRGQLGIGDRVRFGGGAHTVFAVSGTTVRLTGRAGVVAASVRISYGRWWRLVAGVSGHHLHGALLVEVAGVSITMADRERHNPYVRAQPSGWDAAGAPSTGTTGSYEVICPACGDDGGPYEQQPPDLQQVRGPHPTARAARRAVRDHRGSAPT